MANSFRNFMLSRTRFGNASGVMSFEGGKAGRLIMPRGFYEVIAIGGGGGAAYQSNKFGEDYDASTLTGKFSIASGGGASSVKCRVRLESSGIASYSVGKGGSSAGGVYTDYWPESISGFSGGATSLTINEVNITCNGGAGGVSKGSAKGTSGSGGAAPTVIGVESIIASGAGTNGGAASYKTSLANGTTIESNGGDNAIAVDGYGGGASSYLTYLSKWLDFGCDAKGENGYLWIGYFGTVRPEDWD